MNDKNLQYFLTVANDHSISVAARKLYITQPSLSQAIKRIEDSVGAPLFKRTANGLQLTNVGEQFYTTAMQTEKLWQNFSLNINAPDELKEGSLSFGITVQFGLMVLSDILIRFNQKFPKINCNVYDQNHIELEKNLLNGNLDLAITHIQHHQERPALFYDTFLRDPFVVITSPEKDFGDIPDMITDSPDGPEIDIHKLKDEKFIYPKKENQTRRIIDSALAQGNIVNPQEYLVNNQFQTIQSLVSAGLGIGIIPRSYISQAIKVNIYNIPTEYNAYWDLCIVTRKNYTLSYLEECFINIAKEICVSICEKSTQ